MTPTALLADAWERADAWEPGLGAVVRRLDRVAERPDGPLAGVVVGIKDALAVAGFPREVGAPDAVARDPQPTDATAVAGWSEAGATLMAATQVHPLCFGVVTPATRNPRAPDRIAGGSSGGSAAALAAGLVHLAIGTDTGGSVRGPAACCGIVGLKTTRGLVGLSGACELAWSLDTIGPMATSVWDVELGLAAMLRPDPDDPVYMSPPPFLPASPGPLRIGVPRQLEDTPIDPEVREVWQATLDDLRADGHRVVGIDLPSLIDAPAWNGLILSTEAAAVLGDLTDAPTSALPEEVRDRIRWGARQRGSDVAVARRRATVFAGELRAACREVDVICTPTLACRLPRVGEDEVVVDGSTQRTTFAMTKLTNPWNLLGVPAGTVPAGRDSDGAPIGMQLIGPWWSEPTVLRAMEVVERVRGGSWPVVTAPNPT